MKNKLSSSGQTKYVWVDYESIVGAESLQIIQWANGDGIEIIKNDDSSINLTWDEWDAIKFGVKELVKPIK